MALKKTQKSLRNWSKEDWTTGSGKPSLETGEAYRPRKEIKRLRKKGLLGVANRIKRAATRAGKQFAKYTKSTKIRGRIRPKK
ncbi:MAG: hypothetical protein CL833_06415 [Crocinitomicaceae bacterium]|jgi:hypothetical protein|nr:hypothetical protein [Crocinitomicaceae bacterium]|tara:strand:- start:222 stop:470 length:249 start_codon:yes stop_codon:yes gene_type:complete